MQTSNTENVLQVYQDSWDTPPAANIAAITKITTQQGAEGFTTLRLGQMHLLEGLEKLDVRNTDFSTLDLDSATILALKEKAIIGKAGQTLSTTDYACRQEELNVLSEATGFDKLHVALNSQNVPATLTLKSDTTVTNVHISSNWGDTGSTMTVKDLSTNETTVMLTGHNPVRTEGVEHVRCSGDATLDTESFAASSGLQDVDVQKCTLHLHGVLTDETLTALENGTVTNVGGLNLKLASITKDFDLDLTTATSRDISVSLNMEQLAYTSLTGARDVTLYGENVTTSDFSAFSAVNRSGENSKINIIGNKDAAVLNMASFTQGVTLTCHNGGTQVGGNADDYLYIHVNSLVSKTSSQNGGEGNDTLTYSVSEYYMLPESWQPHTMTGGNGADTFTLDYHMDSVVTLPEENSTLPGVRIQILDFKAPVAGTPGSLQADKLNLYSVCPMVYPMPLVSWKKHITWQRTSWARWIQHHASSWTTPSTRRQRQSPPGKLGSSPGTTMCMCSATTGTMPWMKGICSFSCPAQLQPIT